MDAADEAVGGEGQLRRLAELAGRVVDQAAATPLFAAWRAMPRPQTPRALAAHSLNLLREWRGGVHVAAVLAAGLSPLDAIMSDGGEFYAQAFGWPRPWPTPEENAEAMAGVRETVDAACGVVLDRALSADEQTELVDLAAKACSQLA